MVGLMMDRRWSRRKLLNRVVEYVVLGTLGLLVVLVVLPANEDAGDFTLHEPGKSRAKH